MKKKKEEAADVKDAEIVDTAETQEVDARILELEKMRGLEGGAEVLGRVYRVAKNGRPGRSAREACGTIEAVLDDDEIGVQFGPGSYQVVYSFRPDEAEPYVKSVYYNIGKEYARKHREWCADNGIEDGDELGASAGPVGFFKNLDAEKIAAIASAFKMFRDIIAPPVDLKSILEIATRPAPPISEAIVTEAMRGMREQNRPPQPDILKQIELVNNLKTTLKDNEESGDDMDGLMKLCLQMLPGLVQKKNGDFEAVGRETYEQNKTICDLIINNKKLLGSFFAEAVNKYGKEKADALARGFGVKLDLVENKKNGK